MRGLARRFIIAAAFSVALAACSGPDGNGQNPPGGGPPPGTPGGMIVAGGTGFIHTFNTDSGTEWQKRLSYSAPWSTVTTIPANRELLIANTSGAEPVVVEVYDLDTFGFKRSFEWPNSTSMTTLHDFAATQDGAYLAITMEALSDPFFEVIEVATGEIVYTGLDTLVGSNFVWTADNDLIGVASLSYMNDPSVWGAIVRIPLQNMLDSEDGNVDGFLIHTFTRAEFDYLGYLALSPDDSELVYTRAGDLWVIEVYEESEPHQLTTGPVGIHGAVFSPNGTHIAVAAGGSYGLDETYVIPLHRGPPLFIDHGQGAGNEYLLEDNTLVDWMLAWLP